MKRQYKSFQFESDIREEATHNLLHDITYGTIFLKLMIIFLHNWESRGEKTTNKSLTDSRTEEVASREIQAINQNDQSDLITIHQLWKSN